MTHRRDSLSDDLLARIRHAIGPGQTIPTLSRGRPNAIVSIEREGIEVETVRSSAKGSGPQLVPAWMIQRAWDHLVRCRSLTCRELVASDGLNVKRSAFVCALLARFPDVEVASSRPITLRMSGQASRARKH